jgi:tRNA A37 methylthiotransferase MiaB
MKNKVEPKIIKHRAQILRKLSDELAFNFREQFINQTCEVLIEGSKDKQAFGHCERYFLVKVTKDCRLPIADCRFNKNEIVRVKITAATKEGASGEPANPKI